MSDQLLISHAPARIRIDLPISDRAIAALDPTVLQERQPYIWPMEISSDRLDAYWTRMDPTTTLRNYAAEAEAGRACLAGHNQRALPFGQTLSGRWEATGDGARVLAEAYTLPGIELGGVRTDDFILGVRAGIVRDVSIGFYGGEWRCSICGRDMLSDWDCWHWPGQLYEIEQPAAPGQVGGTEPVRCTALIVDAHLSEVSAVYDGATPGAMILRAERAMQEGRLTPRQARALEAQYRIRLPERRLLTTGAEMSPQTDETIRETPAPADTPAEAVPQTDDARSLDVATYTAIRAACDLAGAPQDQLLPQRVQWLADELARLRPLADDGTTYRADLVAEALAEGVRALGATFAEETYRGILQTAPIETIRRMRDDWRSQADAVLPAGRQTVDRVDDERPTIRQVPTPASAYRA